MASLTGLAFQIDFLVGRGSRRNAVSQIRDTVDNINLVARHGATKAAKERKANLESQLGELDTLAKKSSENLAKSKDDAAKAVAKRAATGAGAITRKIKADTSAIKETGRASVSVAKQMKTAFSSLNKALAPELQLKGGGFTTEETTLDFASKEAAQRESILETQREINDLKRMAGKLTEGEILQEKTLTHLHKQLNALEKDDSKTQAEIDKEKSRLIREYNEENRIESKELQRQIQLRQELGAAIERMATSIGTTLRNAFVYSTAAIAAFYYKLNGTIDLFKDFENELINAQSIFQTNQEVLFGLSDQIMQFGLNYGVETQNAATGLYQLASAGLSASDSMMVLNDTLMLSMAVQGDHNTIAKLTTQTIFGFGLEMSQSGELVDKFAHAINKSLIEYQDLAAAVKFAMPFFVATGQSVDQLLGSIQVLTNRALEAGIAGRGLRQALSEFAEGAEDSTRKFARLGVKVVDASGNFLQLTEIARNFKNVFGDTASDVELMTTLLEDLNVRGATAFVHLVQNVDEFEGAVNDLQNSAGAAAEMAGIQQASLANQIQILKTSLMAPFLLTDKIGEAKGYMNEFHMVLHGMIAEFSDLIYKVGPDGEKVLTDIGIGMKKFVISAMQELATLLMAGMELFKKYATEVGNTEEVLHLITVPLRVMLRVLELIGPKGIEFILIWKVLNGILPLTSLFTAVLASETWGLAAAEIFQTGAAEGQIVAMEALQLATVGVYAGIGALLLINIAFAKDAPFLAAALSTIAGAFMGLAIGIAASRSALEFGIPGIIAAMVVGGIAGIAFSAMMAKVMTPGPVVDYAKDIEPFDIQAHAPTADLGMRIPSYDTGGRPAHTMAWVEPGETITSRTQNMVGGNQALGGAGGLSIYISGDVYDAENFAAKIGQVLPSSLTGATDVGSMDVRTSRFGSTFGKPVINRGRTITGSG